MYKEKLNVIKNKIKNHAPEIIAISSGIAITVVAYVVYNRISSKISEDYELSIMTGDAKKKLIGRDDAILSKIDEQNYILFLENPIES